MIKNRNATLIYFNIAYIHLFAHDSFSEKVEGVFEFLRGGAFHFFPVGDDDFSAD